MVKIKRNQCVLILALLAAMVFSSCRGKPVQVGSSNEMPKDTEPVIYSSQKLSEDSVSATNEVKPWTEYKTIAHALGSVEGRMYTNTLDALIENYEKGQRVFEVDLQLTSDGFLVCRHDWYEGGSYALLEQDYAGVMDINAFRNSAVCYYFSPLDINGLLAYMRTHPEMYIVTDSKDTDEETVRMEMRQLENAVKETADESLWNRIVVQVYNDNMFYWVAEEVPVKNWIYTLYQIGDPDYERIGDFCRTNGIAGVTMEQSRVSQSHTETLRKYGVKVFAHTINSLNTMKKLSPLVDGFYTDIVTPNELQKVLDGTAVRRNPWAAAALQA